MSNPVVNNPPNIGRTLAQQAKEAFYTDLLDDHIVTRRYKNGATLVDMMFLTDVDNATSLEDTAIFGFVLDVRSPNASTDTSIKLRQTSYNSNANQAGQNKRSQLFAPTYNKYIVVADLLNPPKVAVLIPRSLLQSAEILLQMTEHKPFVGEPFYIYEPSITTTTIGKALTPVLNTEESPHVMLPLKGATPVPYLESTEHTMTLPSRPGETNYFVLTNKTCKVSRFALSTDVSCVGTECDRQKGKGGCTCLHSQASHSALVYEFDVTFLDFTSTNVNFLGRNNVFVVPKFKSLKATKLFFQNFIRFCDTTPIKDQKDMIRDLRAKVTGIVDFVNSNGGWTAVGWFMLGQVADASEDTADKLDNTNVTPHLTYLHPSNENIVLTEEYKSLQIGFQQEAPPGTNQTTTSNNNASRRQQHPASGTTAPTTSVLEDAASAGRTRNSAQRRPLHV